MGLVSAWRNKMDYWLADEAGTGLGLIGFKGQGIRLKETV